MEADVTDPAALVGKQGSNYGLRMHQLVTMFKNQFWIRLIFVLVDEWFYC